MSWPYLTLLLLFHATHALPQVTVTESSGGGVTFTIPDEHFTLATVHFSINQELSGIAFGQHGVDIKTHTGNTWVYTNDQVQLNEGDIVNYWVRVVQDGLGKQILNQHWKCCGGTSSHTHNTHTDDHVDTGGTTDTGGTHAGPNGTVVQQHTQTQCTSYPCLVFEDNFDTFNFDVWEHEISASGGGNWEFQYYLNNRSNSYVKDGKLFIKPTLTSDRFGEPFLSSGSLDLWGFVANDVCTGNAFYGCQRTGSGEHYINPIQSARLRSIRGLNMKFGKLEIEAKMPTGDWIWPAIWLLPKWNRYGSWPASGEIDICESRGNRQLVDGHGHSIGVNAMGSTLHFGTDYLHNGWAKTHADKILSSGTFGDGFHKYVLEWDENGLRTTVDGDEVLNVTPDDDGFYKLGEFAKYGLENPWRNVGSKMAPFDQEFYLILNVAVGGTGGYWSDNVNGKPWSNAAGTALRDFWKAHGAWYPTWNPDSNDGEDAAMQINYVRYWKTKP